MNHSKLLRRLIGGFLAVATVSVFTFSGCTTVDDSLGSDLTLENQALKLGQMHFSGLTENGTNYFQSRLYRTDSMNTAILGSGYLGMMGNDTFGVTRASFYTQYITSYTIDEDMFGHMPIFDSAMLYISVSSYGGDTSVVQQYEVYEIIDDSFVSDSADSIFFYNFDVEPYIASEPIFTFKFPDQDNEIYVATSSLRLTETPLTSEFISRLMLENENDEYDYEIYDDDETWVEYFKGLYIRPVDPIASIDNAEQLGAIYQFSLESSGFGFYGRSREEVDPTLIKDTIGMSYVFYSSYADAGNVSINCFEHDYDGSLIDVNEVMTPTTTVDISETSVLRVEGMGGVVSQITFAEEFFEQLDTILEGEHLESGEQYTSLFFNQALFKIYMQEVNGYDPSAIDPFLVTDWMNYMPSSLGLYTDYSYYYIYDEDDEDDYYISLSGVADYLYAYESSYTLDFDGSLNRSWGCYVMNISNHIQTIWNGYLSAKEEAEENNTEIDYDSIAGRTVYLAPRSTSLYSMKFASLQAGDPTLNSAPMQLDITYTMIR